MSSLWQNAMIALARSERLTAWIQANPRLSAMAGQFVSGPCESAAVETACRLRGQGIRSSIFYLGEYTTDPRAIEETVASLIRVMAVLDARGLDTHISVDPSQIGFAISKALGEVQARAIAAAYPDKRTAQSFLMVDMEDVTYVQPTLELRRMLADLGIPAAITLQSYLRRTGHDLDAVLAEGAPSVRLVKGAFSQPAPVAWTSRSDISASYLRLANRMLAQCAGRAFHPVFATHDEAMIEPIREQARKSGLRPGQYEFEMLYGVRPELQSRLLAGGEQLRLYLPYGTHWWPYTIRRVGESPRNLRFVWKAVMG